MTHPWNATLSVSTDLARTLIEGQFSQTGCHKVKGNTGCSQGYHRRHRLGRCDALS